MRFGQVKVLALRLPGTKTNGPLYTIMHAVGAGLVVDERVYSLREGATL
jgi:hypothetical protein